MSLVVTVLEALCGAFAECLGRGRVLPELNAESVAQGDAKVVRTRHVRCGHAGEVTG